MTQNILIFIEIVYIDNCSFLAEYVTTCQIKKPEFINCSTNAVQKLFNAIPSGVPEINLDPLDPLKVPLIKVSLYFLNLDNNIFKCILKFVNSKER